MPGGIRLGNIEAKLLTKIEELTLHQIDQEKRLSLEEQELSALRSENTTIKAMLGDSKKGK